MTLQIIHTYVDGEPLTATQLNTIQAEYVKAVDGYGGGTFEPSSAIKIGGSGIMNKNFQLANSPYQDDQWSAPTNWVCMTNNELGSPTYWGTIWTPNASNSGITLFYDLPIICACNASVKIYWHGDIFESGYAVKPDVPAVASCWKMTYSSHRSVSMAAANLTTTLAANYIHPNITTLDPVAVDPSINRLYVRITSPSNGSGGAELPRFGIVAVGFTLS